MLATHVPLGMQVLDRGIVFIDLAIAQIAGLGVIAADALGSPEGGLTVQVAAVGAALLGAWLLTWTERRAPQQQEALIGVMFILAACAGILLLASNPHGGEHLKDLLVGQILWVNNTQLLWLAGVSALLLLAMRLGWVARLGRFGFYGAFALAVTASVQLVGVYLVFSSLIIPALGTRTLHGRAAPASGLCHRRRRLCARSGAVGVVRPPLRRGDRLGLGCMRAGRGVGDAACCGADAGSRQVTRRSRPRPWILRRLHASFVGHGPAPRNRMPAPSFEASPNRAIVPV